MITNPSMGHWDYDNSSDFHGFALPHFHEGGFDVQGHHNHAVNCPHCKWPRDLGQRPRPVSYGADATKNCWRCRKCLTLMRVEFNRNGNWRVEIAAKEPMATAKTLDTVVETEDAPTNGAGDHPG